MFITSNPKSPKSASPRKSPFMTSREKILAATKQNQPSLVALPDYSSLKEYIGPNADQFMETLKLIGGKPIEVKSIEEVISYLQANYGGKRMVTTIPELETIAQKADATIIPQLLEDVIVAIIKAQFGVAENGAVWLTENEMVVRALPFIPTNLAIILPKNNIVNTMHEAYDKIGNMEYGFGTFIAGPSKTADIEQSLVLGAHGPKTMTVFLLG
jgi:L-lactate dehydrogenase complex protein LldG